jgi:hypothetical protein
MHSNQRLLRPRPALGSRLYETCATISTPGNRASVLVNSQDEICLLLSAFIHALYFLVADEKGRSEELAEAAGVCTLCLTILNVVVCSTGDKKNERVRTVV